MTARHLLFYMFYIEYIYIYTWRARWPNCFVAKGTKATVQLLLVYLSFGGPLLELETGTSFDGCRPLLLTQELSVEEWRCAHAACAVQTGDKKHGVGT